MNLIAAVSRDWGIGKNGDLLFHIKQDMKFFKETTMNHVVVMGRKTLDSFPNKKPLVNRVNIVLTRDKEFSREGVIAVHSLDELLAEVKKYNDDVFVIGGGEVYKMLMPYCQRAYITKVNEDADADTFLPNIEKDENWQLVNSSKEFIEGNRTFQFVVYERNQVR